MDFDKLYEAAYSVLRPRKLSSDAYAGSVSAAILSDSGKIYTGVCIDTPSSMGFCAEHAAIAAMVTAGESKITKMIALYKDGSILPPCGRCREFVHKIHDDNHACLVKVSSDKVVTIKDLLPMEF